MSVMTFINEKGGNGKTTVTFHTAWELSKKNKVLIIDLDGQDANISDFLGIKKTKDILTIRNVLLQELPIEESIIKINNNLHVIPADKNVTELGSTQKIARFKKEIERIKNNYDYIFIDVNCDGDNRHLLTFLVCDYVVIVIRPELVDCKGINGITNSLNDIYGLNPNIKELGYVIDFYSTERLLNRESIESIENHAKIKNVQILGRIKTYDAISRSVLVHKGVTEYRSKSNAALVIKELVKNLKNAIKKSEV